MSGLSFSETRRALANRDYALYTLGNFVSLTGNWAQRLAVGWLAWEYTNSPAWLGAILFADLAPTIILGPIGGAVSDRFDRLRLAQLTVWLSLGQAVFLAAFFFTGLLNIWWLLGATIYLGVVNSFNQSVRLALVPMLVPERDIARAMPINSISFNMARFSGPALFGLIVLIVPVGHAMVFNAASYVLFGVVLMGLHPRTEKLAESKDRNLLADVADGIRYALTHPGIGPLLIVLIASSFGTRAFFDLLPGLVGQVFNRGPEALSVLTSVTSAGALVGAVYLSLRTSIVGLASVSMTASMLVGVGLIAFTATDIFGLGAAILFLVGIGLSISATGVLSLVQSTVRGEMRGRVVSLYGIIFRGGPAVGGLVMGWIGEWTGLRWPVAGGGLLCVLAYLWVVRRLPAVRRELETDQTAKEAT